MSRPRKDGTPAEKPTRRKLTDSIVKSAKAKDRLLRVWDTHCPHLALVVRPTGKKTWTIAYRFHGRDNWYYVGDARNIGLADARQIAQEVMLDVARGKDPAAERKKNLEKDTFADVAALYVESYAKERNKSWRHAEALVAKHLLPKWGKLPISAITQADVHDVMIRTKARMVANLVRANASAIFTWAIKRQKITVNPCHGVDRYPTTDRARVLSDDEIRLLWPQFDAQLKLILLTGQRPGEVAAMRREDIVGGWWMMSGKPTGTWPGIKNKTDHRVWLSEPALALIDQHLAEKKSRNECAKLIKKLVTLNKIERATPHDLRRTCLTTITRLKFGRDAMDRIANHRTGSKVTRTYDRYEYEDEDQEIMTKVAWKIAIILKGPPKNNVVNLR